MSNSIQIAPSILAADFMRLGEQIQACEKAGADAIHCDVMDGRFVPNLTFGPPLIAQLSKITTLELDVHLMIDAPERSIDQYAKAGAHAITVHQEVSPHLHRTLHAIKDLGCKAGVSINPSTPVELLEPVLEDLDLLLFMSVNPGFGGQSFIESTVKKIAQAVDWKAQGRGDYVISVDGGIDPSTAPKVAAAGATLLVAGTAVFKGDIAANIKRLRGAC